MYESGAKQYQKVNVTSEVMEADPHRLIQLLMEAALTRMAQAKGAIQRSDMQEKARLLGRVNEIIQTLQSSLDHSRGGDLSGNLDRLYDYMVRRLLEATGKNDTDMIDEVMGLMLSPNDNKKSLRMEALKCAFFRFR